MVIFGSNVNVASGELNGVSVGRGCGVSVGAAGKLGEGVSASGWNGVVVGLGSTGAVANRGSPVETGVNACPGLIGWINGEIAEQADSIPARQVTMR